MTYRHDSDIVIGNRYRRKNGSQQEFFKNITLAKIEEYYFIKNLTLYGITELEKRSKDIAWLVSHCNTPSKREKYVEDMKKNEELKIDIFGNCSGKNSVDSTKLPSRHHNYESGYDILAQQYKFYLSFENAKCYNYITEKFFLALNSGMLPIVMGGLSKHDYEKIAPPHSFIHVDDFQNSAELMMTLYRISKNPVLYNSYFWWRTYYEFYSLNHKCQLCNVLNSKDFVTKNNYENFNSYWYKCMA